jgi:hypothetical protein
MLKHVSSVYIFWFARHVLITVFSMPRPEEQESPDRLHPISYIQCQIKSHCSPSNTTNMFSAFFCLTPNLLWSHWFITGSASRFLLKFAQHIFLIYMTPVTDVILTAYSSRESCYRKRPQRQTNDASGKEPKGSQQLRRSVKETAADTVPVPDGQQRIFISLQYYPLTDDSIFKGFSLLKVLRWKLCTHFRYLSKLVHPDLLILIFYEQYKVLSS